jgi:hypothetical protein
MITIKKVKDRVKILIDVKGKADLAVHIRCPDNTDVIFLPSESKPTPFGSYTFTGTEKFVRAEKSGFSVMFKPYVPGKHLIKVMGLTGSEKIYHEEYLEF